MSDGLDRLAGLLGRAALDVWGDMPREIQEALFETAMQGRQAEPRNSPACCATITRARSTPRSLAGCFEGAGFGVEASAGLSEKLPVEVGAAQASTTLASPIRRGRTLH